MNPEVVITCAVTGAGDTVGRHPDIPVTPEQIAASAIDAAKAGAAIVHCHVRDPATGKGSRDVALYREVVSRIRDSEVDVVINLTSGMGVDLVIGPDEAPTEFGQDTDLVGALDRLPHVEELLPEICSLDCGSLNFGEGSMVYVSTPDMLRQGAKTHPRTGCQARVGGIRYWPPELHAADAERRSAGGSAAFPALLRHPVGCARRRGGVQGVCRHAAARCELDRLRDQP